MTTLEAIITKFYGEDILVADGFDEAVIGIEESSIRLIYSVTKCLEIIEAMGIPENEALEFFYLKVYGIYSKDESVIFCFDDFKDIIDD
jgi:hypothetical protein